MITDTAAFRAMASLLRATESEQLPLLRSRRSPGAPDKPSPVGPPPANQGATLDLPPGEIIDTKYTITALLGRGGMGVVYAATDRDLGTPVAIKFLLPSLAARPDIVSRFLHEARAGIRIKSLHVARIQAVGTHAGSPFIVMEHLTGEDLGVTLEKRGPLSVQDSADLLLQACEAIHEAHALKIVHRDLKPSNLFCTDGPDGLKVLDFGISKSPFAEAAAKTATVGVMGSPFYMSPEQIVSTKSVGPRSDIWSLGIILYEMLTDTVPYAGTSVPDIHEAILRAPWTRLSEHREGLPDPIELLVSQAVERDLERRIGTVLEFATRLAPFGNEIAAESLARIRRVAAHNSSAPPAGAKTEKTSELDVATIKEDLSPTARQVPLAARRWASAAVAVSLAGALGVAGAFLLLRHPDPPSPVMPIASVAEPAPSAAAPVVEPVAPSAVAPLPSASTVVSAPPTPPSPTKAACTGTVTPACEAACNAHATGACDALAFALLEARGPLRDPARAATLYRSSCDAGSMMACSSLGALYARGDGVGQSDPKAVDLYQRACDGNYARGCLNLGSIYFDGGIGVKADEVRAAGLFRRACDAGERLGCHNLSIAYRDGRGVRKSAERAIEFDEKSKGLR